MKEKINLQAFFDQIATISFDIFTFRIKLTFLYLTELLHQIEFLNLIFFLDQI